MVMWGRQRERDRRRARALAEQTANRVRARNERLIGLGLRVNDDGTVTGQVEQEVEGDVRVEVRFENYPADNALAELQRDIDRLRAQAAVNAAAQHELRPGDLLAMAHGNARIFIEGLEQGARGSARKGAMTEEERKAAIKKAKETLTRFLTPVQRRTYENHHYFELVGSAGNRYRIRTNDGYSGNVRLLLGDREAGKFCAYPQPYCKDGRYIPKEDAFLGQLLQLITDENSYLDKANLFSGNFPVNHPKHAVYAREFAMRDRLEELQQCLCERCEELLHACPPRGRYAFDPRYGPRVW